MLDSLGIFLQPHTLMTSLALLSIYQLTRF
jgi:hypothetical protein